MNSKVYNDALKDKIISIDSGGADSYNSGMIPKMLGMTPKATDKLTETSSVYPSYLQLREQWDINSDRDQSVLQQYEQVFSRKQC